MGKIIYLMGKSSSGKDTIFKELLKMDTSVADHAAAGQTTSPCGRKLRTVTPYTTRPIRAGERDGVEYFFTDEEGFQRLLAQGKVIEHREYDTFHGLWRYFTVDDGQFELDGQHDYVMIGTLEAYSSMCAYFGQDKLIPVLIELDDGVRLQRALDREKQQEDPKYEEMCRRFLADSSDFSEEKISRAGIKRRFQNDDLQICLQEIARYIKESTEMSI